MKDIPIEIVKQIEEAASKEEIYEPKYGGKDHSGYETMMKYEINDERYECFEKGAYFGYKLSLDEIKKYTGISDAMLKMSTELIKLREFKNEVIKGQQGELKSEFINRIMRTANEL